MEHFIGIDLGGTNIAAGAVSADGRLLCRYSVPTRPGRPAEAVLDDMAQAARAVQMQTGEPLSDCAGVGVGVPGVLSADGTRVLTLPNLPWRDLPLAALLEQRLSLHVVLGNDADCAALGEYTAGAGKEFSSLLMITIGTGLGGGLICGGRIFAGFHGEGFEPGHIPFLYGGIPCGCGKRGCLESYLSASALIRETRREMQLHPDSLLWSFAPRAEDVTAKTPFDAAGAGDESARRVLKLYTSWLAEGLGGLSTLFRPDAVVLGGGVSRQGSNLLRLLTPKYRQACYASDRILPAELLCATLGNEAGIIGAALIARPDARQTLATGGTLF